MAETVVRGVVKQAKGSSPKSAPPDFATDAPAERETRDTGPLSAQDARGIAIPQPPDSDAEVGSESSEVPRVVDSESQQAAATAEALPEAAEVPAEVSEEPVHVSAEPELVQEFAEPGAEDGAGAEITVDEPWTGYDQMKADEVVSRLADASEAELAAVQLYERAHRERDMVLSAVESRFKLVSRGGAQ